MRWLMSLERPIVILEDGFVQQVLGVKDYTTWDWDYFLRNPAEYWEEHGEQGRADIRNAFDAESLREIEEAVAEDLAYDVEERLKLRQADPFWMVEAR